VCILLVEGRWYPKPAKKRKARHNAKGVPPRKKGPATHRADVEDSDIQSEDDINVQDDFIEDSTALGGCVVWQKKNKSHQMLSTLPSNKIWKRS